MANSGLGLHLKLKKSSLIALSGLINWMTIPSSLGVGGASTVQVANSPESNFQLATEAIRSAKDSLLVNFYQFTDPSIASALEERIRAGVRVEILQEGSPIGGLPEASREIQNRLTRAMEEASRGPGAEVRYFQMQKPAQGKRRYRFDHAKYMVIDSGAVWLGSENFTRSGMPAPGNAGNRGWSALIQDSALSSEFTGLFRTDTSMSFGDIALLAGQSALGRVAYAFNFGLPGVAVAPMEDPSFAGVSFVPWSSSSRSELAPLRAFPVLRAENVKGVHSPDNSLPGLLELIQSATRSIDVEQMSLYKNWKASERTSPLMDALIAAARKGIRVRVLLNDEAAFFNRPPNESSGGPRRCEDADEEGGCPSPDNPDTPENEDLQFLDSLDSLVSVSLHHGFLPRPAPRPAATTRFLNRETVKYLRQVASQEGIPLQARIADLEAMGAIIIHNKGVIVDGRRTLVSSINWTENSVLRNRETGVVIDSDETGAYYASLFERDWQASAWKPESERRSDRP